MAIANQSLSTGGNNIFVCPADQEHAVTCVVFCNYSISTVTIKVYAIPSGVVSVSDASIVIKDLELPASETFTFDTEKFVLSAGDRLHAVSSANSSVTATVSSMRVS
jgi:hypothetical protein